MKIERTYQTQEYSLLNVIYQIKSDADKLRELMDPEEQSIMPDLDQLDKLMRYQTTLQRQLSACIGELLALNKNE